MYWPDGNLFGYLTIFMPKTATKSNKLVLASITHFLQAELKNLFLTHQIESLSMRDNQTYMLNPYGFSMMAPRQLSLSRRFGSHAGLILVDINLNEENAHTFDIRDRKIRQLARIINDTIRTADVAARLNDNQFIILAFLDHESNVDSLIGRLYKQINRTASDLDIQMGKSFFSPDSHFELEPMLKIAEDDLIANREKQPSSLS